MRPEEFYGGSLITAPTGDVQLLAKTQRFVAITPLSDSVRIFLPSALGLELGPRRHLFLNLSSDRFFAVHRGDGSLIGSLPPQWSVWLHLSDNTTSAGTWGIGPFRIAFILSSALEDNREFFNLRFKQGTLTFNVNIRDEVDKLGFSGAHPARVHVSVEGGAFIGSNNTLPAMSTGAFPADSVMAMTTGPGGVILGKGGDGGNGDFVARARENARAGQDGGTALRLDMNTVIINAGAIVGGGGGGGGGGADFGSVQGILIDGGGGGGGAGTLPGVGGGSPTWPGEDGTQIAPGSGAVVSGFPTSTTPGNQLNNGGSGGHLGKPGTPGSPGGTFPGGGAAGAAGASISRAAGVVLQFQVVGALIGPQVVL